MNSLAVVLRSPLLTPFLVLALATACSPGYTSPYSGQSYQSPYVRATQPAAAPPTESTDNGSEDETRPARTFPRNEKDIRRRHELRTERPATERPKNERPANERSSRRTEPGPMPDTSFAELVASIEQASFKDGKLDIVRMAAATNHFTADQAAQLVSLMSFSDSQTDAAVMLYPRLTDPQNAHRLLGTLRFESDRRKVMERLGLTER